MKITIVPVTPYAQNCSVLRCERTGRGAFVDPGGDLDRLLGVAEEMDAQIEKILVTHGHLDHAGGVAEMADRLGVPIEGPHRDDAFWIERLPADCARSGFPPARVFEPERWLENGDTVTVGEQSLEVYHCPGHTPGHVVYFHREMGLAIVGDVLFAGSVGRSDLPRGDHDTLIESIRTRLWPLGEHVQFIPGHGPLSTFGEERRSNPFAGDAVR
ncbi:MAG: MBL fold metallo-hydrolase [Gammaproteobacteria bacterium]|nr:MBL fold metallo-hydrolase [Gammaproteobacteria bacterium]